MPRHEGVATAKAKLMRFLDLKSADGKPLLELYDLVADPDERRNLAGDAAAAPLLNEMLAKLAALRAEYGAPADPALKP